MSAKKASKKPVCVRTRRSLSYPPLPYICQQSLSLMNYQVLVGYIVLATPDVRRDKGSQICIPLKGWARGQVNNVAIFRIWPQWSDEYNKGRFYFYP